MQEERGHPSQRGEQEEDCDVVIDKKYAFDHSTDKIYFYVFVFAPDSAPTTLAWEKTDKGVFCDGKKGDFWTPLKGGDWLPEHQLCD